MASESHSVRSNDIRTIPADIMTQGATFKSASPWQFHKFAMSTPVDTPSILANA